MKKILIFITLIYGPALAGTTNNPIMFVTQYPTSVDFAAIGSTFGNHLPQLNRVGRGGDLYIRYTDGSVRNLTRDAGYGMIGFQGAYSIAVRDPTISWDGTKALFSMLIGGASEQYEVNEYYWQMYEVEGFGQEQAVSITKVNNQPESYNNLTPIYDSENNIIFTTDMPRTKNRYNYPQLDEYDNAASTTGLWKLNRQTGEVDLLQHSPSGSFSPLIDKAGRVVFTRWDHLERDQQAYPSNSTGQFNYASELPGALATTSIAEVFPEPQQAQDPDVVAGINLLTINHFFPWQLNQDGTGEETLNHVGRHELHNYFNHSFNTDTSLEDFIPYLGRPNINVVRNTFMLDEDPMVEGRFIAIDAPEFGTYNAGQIIAFELPIGASPELVTVEYLTHPDTRNPGSGASHSGFYRDAITLSNGTVISSHTSTTDGNNFPYDAFTIKTLSMNNGYLEADIAIANLPNVNISFWSPDVLNQYNGPLWQLQPVEVVARDVPQITSMQLETPELSVMSEENVDVNVFQNYLRNNNLAVVVMRDVTTRDARDKQQPFNLRVAGTSYQNTGDAGQVYNISHLQFVQADQIRGIGGVNDPADGQRVLAQYMHDESATQNNITFTGAPSGSVEIYSDGSVAAFVPAKRAMAWQSLATDGIPVVRERYWINFQPGEIRACGGCHGVNDTDQAGNSESTQQADAFRALLQHWKQNLFSDLIFKHGFET